MSISDRLPAFYLKEEIIIQFIFHITHAQYKWSFSPSSVKTKHVVNTVCLWRGCTYSYAESESEVKVCNVIITVVLTTTIIRRRRRGVHNFSTYSYHQLVHRMSKRFLFDFYDPHFLVSISSPLVLHIFKHSSSCRLHFTFLFSLQFCHLFPASSSSRIECLLVYTQ